MEPPVKDFGAVFDNTRNATPSNFQILLDGPTRQQLRYDLQQIASLSDLPAAGALNTIDSLLSALIDFRPL